MSNVIIFVPLVLIGALCVACIWVVLRIWGWVFAWAFKDGPDE